MHVTRMSCSACRTAVEADFPAQPLGQLPLEHQRFIEMFVLAGGSLKEIANQAGVSYPTVRSRLDKVIAALHEQLTAQCDADSGGDKNDSTTGTAEQAADIIKRI